MELFIKECPNNHHFMDDVCPFCGEMFVKEHKARKGDCIVCGVLCPENAYGCNVPNEFPEEYTDLIFK
jgi:hypothetical protein